LCSRTRLRLAAGLSALSTAQVLANGLSDERLHFAALLDAEKAQALPEFAQDSGCELESAFVKDIVARLKGPTEQ